MAQNDTLIGTVTYPSKQFTLQSEHRCSQVQESVQRT